MICTLKICIFVACCFASFVANVSTAAWPKGVKNIQYESAGDRSQQPAKFYAPKASEPAPLLVGLHSWSADYRQTYPGAELAKWCVERGWAFVGPNFRGPNRNPKACGSELVVADIVSAVDYAKQHVNVDPSRIYLMGASGGGYCALLMAGRNPDLWAGVSAWVPITGLAAWHAETKKAGRKYWKDLEASCGGAPGSSKAIDEQYRKRSPLTWLARAKGVPLDINAGITDGHNGSVPISHSLHAFNIVADAKDRIGLDVITAMTKSPKLPSTLQMAIDDPSYGDKKPLFRRSSGSARVTIFQGGHEVVSQAGLKWLSMQRKAKK